MAINALYLPEYVQLDGRYETSGYDANLVAWPNTKNGTYDLNQKSGWATAPHTVTAGPTVPVGMPNGAALIEIVYQDVHWWMIPNTATTIPDFLTKILQTANSGFTIT